MSVFEAGQFLETRSACSHDCIYQAKVIKRTEKTVTIETRGEKKPKRVKIHIFDGVECIFPFGQYSMAPIMRAE